MSIPARSRGQLDVAARTSRAAARVELPVAEFIHTQGAGGLLLLCAAIAAMVWANSPFASSYFRFWNATISFDFGLMHVSKSLHHWINDGLMAIFFFLVGMEIKHEFVRGQLSTFKRAALPVFAALGGMIVPAAIYFAVNKGGASHGWGVPMATDIAFALAVLALVPGVHIGLKIFLLALAIADDLGAILVIAVFYTERLNLGALALAAVFVGVVVLLRMAEVRLTFPYVILGVFAWYCTYYSGIHATVAGVVLAFVVSSDSPLPTHQFESAARPFLESLRSATQRGDQEAAQLALGSIDSLTAATESPLERITRQLHSWVSYLILPLFALANAGVSVSADALRRTLSDPIALGIGLGLLLGKPLGILAFSWASVRMRLAELPKNIRWNQIAGVGLLAGIGFTVAIFIADLAFDTPEQIASAKLAILTTSTLAGVLGFLWLWLDSRSIPGRPRNA